MGMFGSAFTGWHLVIIIAVIVLLFGAPKLPGLAKSVGQSMKIFRNEVRSMQSEDEHKNDVQAAQPQANTTAAPTATVPSAPVTTDQPKQ